MVSKETLALRRRRIALGVLGLLILSGAWEGYAYIASAPQRAAAAFKAGMASAELGNFPAALKSLTRSLDISDRQSRAYLERGIVYQNLKQNELARADFQKALELEPSLGSAHVALSTIYKQQGDTQKALDELSKAIVLDSGIDAYYERGQLYETLGEHQKAIDDYNIAIAQWPVAPFVYMSRAQARENLGDLDGAQEDRETGKKLLPRIH